MVNNYSTQSFNTMKYNKLYNFYFLFIFCSKRALQVLLIMIIIYMFSRGGHSCSPQESTTLLTLLPVFILASLELAFFYPDFRVLFSRQLVLK